MLDQLVSNKFNGRKQCLHSLPLWPLRARIDVTDAILIKPPYLPIGQYVPHL